MRSALISESRNAEYHFAKFCCAECRNDECLNTKNLNAECLNPECLIAESFNAECLNAECRYFYCRGILKRHLFFPFVRGSAFYHF